MSRPALLDVNVLVALFNPDRMHHEAAHDWFADDQVHGWATCPLTENGFVRLFSRPKSGVGRLCPSDLLTDLRKFCSSGHHEFWPDAISLADSTLFDGAFLGGHRQVTDIYLLGLAKKKGGTLVTFDRTIPLEAVKGATRATLTIIGPS